MYGFVNHIYVLSIGGTRLETRRVAQADTVGSPGGPGGSAGKVVLSLLFYSIAATRGAQRLFFLTGEVAFPNVFA